MIFCKIDWDKIKKETEIYVKLKNSIDDYLPSPEE